MDLRVLVLTADLGLSELIRAQVENLGCVCTLRESYDEASSSIDWADAAIVDLVDEGIDVAIRIGALPDSSLIAHRVGEIRRLLVASPAYSSGTAGPSAPAI